MGKVHIKISKGVNEQLEAICGDGTFNSEAYNLALQLIPEFAEKEDQRPITLYHMDGDLGTSYHVYDFKYLSMNTLVPKEAFTI